MEKRFFADNMLGRLSRWLRVLGYDVGYARKSIDNDTLIKAYREGRILLTRNRALYNRLQFPKAVFIDSDDFKDQVREVINLLGLEYNRNRILQRCLICNSQLNPIEKEKVQTRVPPYVFHTVESFMICPDCMRVFWSGTHIIEMERIIKGFWEKGER